MLMDPRDAASRSVDHRAAHRVGCWVIGLVTHVYCVVGIAQLVAHEADE